MHIVARYKSISNQPDNEEYSITLTLERHEKYCIVIFNWKKDQIRNRFNKNATNYISKISDVGLPKRNILMK